jgi:hypothetical protein
MKQNSSILFQGEFGGGIDRSYEPLFPLGNKCASAALFFAIYYRAGINWLNCWLFPVNIPERESNGD